MLFLILSPYSIRASSMLYPAVSLLNQLKFLAFLHSLCSAAYFKLEEKIGGMSFNRVERNEKLVGNFLVREAFGHEFEHFILPLADAERINAALIKLEGWIGNDDCFLFGEL